MSADLLERATRALREETALRETTLRQKTQPHPAAFDRVLARLERQPSPPRVSMRHVRIAALTLAASLLGVGAWANVTGRVSWFAPESPSAAPPEPAATPERVAAPPRPRRSAPPAEAPEPPEAREPVLEAPAATLTVSPSETPAPRVQKPKAAPAPTSQRARPAPAAVDADALYRAAHEAHFNRGDYAAALPLWDRYLAAAEPGHRWTIEARYNRGIALYQLGQAGPARGALEPFARGEYGAYRRADARRLLDALEHSEHSEHSEH